MIDTVALREKVLDLAIRGKLVPQDPNDEPASVLLERIRAQKQQMVKEGKLKAKDIKDDSIIFVGEDNLHYEKFADGTVKCIEDEIPFELPEGWAWTRIGSIAIVKGGKRVPKGMTFSSEPTQHAYVRVTDMKNHTVNLSDLKYIDETVFTEIKNYTIAKNDLYITIAGTIGAVGEFPDELDGMNLTENAVKVTAITLNKTFLCLMMQTEYVQKQFKHKTYQVAMPKLGLERILTTLIPICSLSTQNKICKAVNDASIYIDIISKNYQGLSDTITATKSKILDLAIRGKLVPQNPNDEPATMLLERIRAEKEELIKQGKIKRDKKESVIFKGEDNSYYEKIFNGTAKCIDDEIPCTLPQGWEWCRLNTLSDSCTNSFVDGPFGSNLKTEHYTQKREVRIIQLNNIGEFVWKDIGVKYTTFKHAETLDRCITLPEDIVIAKMMPAGRAIIVPQVESIYVISSDCVRLRTHKQIYNKYLMFAINSNIVNKQIQDSVHGIGRSRTSLSKCKELLIPIPPLKEQVCIVDAIETAYKQLGVIVDSLN